VRLALLVSFLLVSFGAAAADAEQTRTRNLLFFSGADFSTVSSFTWTGLDTPLFGPRDRSGPILRVVGGTGRYSYTADGVEDGEVNGMVTAGEFLLGWRVLRQKVYGAVLLGVEAEQHLLDRVDPDNHVQGLGVGLRIAGEVSWKPTERWRMDLSGAYGSAFDLYRARAAVGYNAFSTVLAGAEAEASQNTGSEQARLGLFVEGVRLGRLFLKASGGGLYDTDGFGGYGRVGADIYW
jgi:hypothetical protein